MVIINVLIIAIVFAVSPVLMKPEFDVPQNVLSVSRFIKEFHKNLQDDSYPLMKSELLDREFPSIIENISFTVKTDVPEKNISSFVKCSSKPVGTMSVEVVNPGRLSSLLTTDPNITSRLVEGPCLALLFFSPNCPFSCLAAPHYNALPRAFPSIKVIAINAVQHQIFNTQFGIAGVPTIMIFHNGKPVAKYNDSDYTLEMFSKFISRIAGIQAQEKMFVLSSDFGGPVPTILKKETDYVLGLAWAVILIALAYGTTRLERWRRFVESLAAIWREANHDQTD